MQILFCIVIAMAKVMSGKHFLRFLSKSDTVITSRIKNLEILAVPELILSDQLTPRH